MIAGWLEKIEDILSRDVFGDEGEIGAGLEGGWRETMLGWERRDW